MKDEFAIAIPVDDLRRLSDSDFEPKDLIRSLFEDEENDEVLKTNCLYYHCNNIGFVTIKNFDLEFTNFDRTSLAGNLICNFTIDHYFHSNNCHLRNEETIRWEYQICVDKQMVRFWAQELANTA